MTNCCRLMSPFVAAICIATITWATPAAAAEAGAPVKAVSAKSSDIRISPSATKRHAWRRTHIALSRHRCPANLLGASEVCSGVWCGRQFVLMVGIGY